MSHAGYGKEMKTVALAILVMGVSIALIFLAYVFFGHVGPSFSSAQQQAQEDALREQYGMEPREKVTAEELEVPPSLRNATS